MPANKQMHLCAGMTRTPSLPSLDRTRSLGFADAPHIGHFPSRNNPRWALKASATTSTDPLATDEEDRLRRHLDLSLHLRTPLPRLAVPRPSNPTLKSSFRTGKGKRRPPALQMNRNSSLPIHRSTSLPRMGATAVRPDLIATRANNSDRPSIDSGSIDHIFGRSGHDDQRTQLGAGRRRRSASAGAEIHIHNHRRVRFRPSTPGRKSLPPTPDSTPPQKSSPLFTPTGRSGSGADSIYSELSFEFGEEVDEAELFYRPSPKELTSFLLTPSPDPALASQVDSISSVLSPDSGTIALSPDGSLALSPIPVRLGRSPTRASFLATEESPVSWRRSPYKSPSVVLPVQQSSNETSEESYFGLQAPENSIDGHSPSRGLSPGSAVTAPSFASHESALDDLKRFPSPPNTPHWSPRSSFDRGPVSETMLRTISV